MIFSTASMRRISSRLLEYGANLLGFSLSPRDRILSAISEDGVIWHRERGLRHDVGGIHSNEMVYYCHVIPLVIGGYRMYYYGSILEKAGWRGRILSAVSRDGLQWKDEPGVRVAFGGEYDAQHARAPSLGPLPGGYWRMYYTGVDHRGIGRILSAISSDGLEWKKEDDVRLEPTIFEGVGSLMDCCVVSLEDGRLRLYVSAINDPLTDIRSAVSDDGLQWEPEPGVRIVCGHPGRKLAANNPCVIAGPEGWRMYFRGGDKLALDNNIYWASSKDGSVWQVQGVALAHEKNHRFERHAVAFPFVMRLPDGRWRMYYTGYWGRHWKEHRVIAAWQQATERALLKWL